MRKPTHGGGWQAIAYTLRMARRAGGFWKLYRAMRRRNTCKTCALGMGGQRGGMVNERGHFPEVCKKSMQAMVADMQGRIAPEFFTRYGFDELRALSPRELESCGRLNAPLFAGPADTHYRVISWDEALSRAAERFMRTPAIQNFFYFSGRASNEAAFLWQLFARLYGTNHVNNCSYYCHQASGVGLRDTLGTATATITLDDVERCDLFFLIGGNPASNHPRLMTMLADLRRRGGHVVVINPLREAGLVEFRVPSRPLSLLFGDKIASVYMQPHAGGDAALLTGIAKALCEKHADSGNVLDERFIDEHADGAREFRRHLVSCEWADIERLSGVPREEMTRVADLYARSQRTIFGWTMGITHHVHGVDNVRAIVNLALLRGMVGKPGAGMLPIRGHSNVQGVGSVGVVPKLHDGVIAALEAKLGAKLPTGKGLDTLACLAAAERGELSNAWCLGGNLFGSSPDARWAQRAIGRLESIAYVSTTLNTGHAWGRAKETLILPARARDEEAQPTTQESMFNFVRLSDGGPARLAGARSEVEIVADLGRRVLGKSSPLDWSTMERHAEIRKLIAEVIPGYEPIREIDATKREFQIAGRTFHEPRFRTVSGKAQFRVVSLARRESGEDALRLITLRSEGQFNTVVYEDEDLYRGQERRDVVLMNADDMRRIGIAEDQPVFVRSAAGEMRGVLARSFEIRAGNAAMYYPECNVLVPRDADPESHTPAFKNVAVTIAAESAGRLPIAAS